MFNCFFFYLVFFVALFFVDFFFRAVQIKKKEKRKNPHKTHKNTKTQKHKTTKPTQNPHKRQGKRKRKKEKRKRDAMFICNLIDVVIAMMLFIVVVEVLSKIIHVECVVVEGLENADTSNDEKETTTTNENKQENKGSNAMYVPYDTSNNVMILAQQNAGNIQVLKGQVDEIGNVKDSLEEMKRNISLLQTQVDSIAQQQAAYATELVGTTTPEIQGTN